MEPVSKASAMNTVPISADAPAMWSQIWRRDTRVGNALFLFGGGDKTQGTCAGSLRQTYEIKGPEIGPVVVFEPDRGSNLKRIQ